MKNSISHGSKNSLCNSKSQREGVKQHIKLNHNILEPTNIINGLWGKLQNIYTSYKSVAYGPFKSTEDIWLFVIFKNKEERLVF